MRVNAHFYEYDPARNGVKHGSSKAVAGIMCLPGITASEHPFSYGGVCPKTN
jgi:hypothetical protein